MPVQSNPWSTRIAVRHGSAPWLNPAFVARDGVLFPTMATIWKTRGTFSPGNWTDHGTPMPLAAISARLEKHQLQYQGAEPQSIAPATAYHEYIVIEVSKIDPLVGRFEKPGFYQVTDLRVRDAAFLFVPTPPFR